MYEIYLKRKNKDKCYYKQEKQDTKKTHFQKNALGVVNNMYLFLFFTQLALSLRLWQKIRNTSRFIVRTIISKKK